MRQHAPLWGTRFILAVGVLAGLGTLVHLVGSKPDMLGVNLETYLLAGEGLSDPGALYALAPKGYPSLSWVYPPIVALLFVPAAVLDPVVPIGLLHGSVLLLAGVLLGGLVIFLVEMVRGPLAVADRGLIIGFAIVSPHAAPSLYYGNLNPLLVLCVGVAIVAMEAGQHGRVGAALAVPAIVKIFPAAFALWLLGLRAWRGLIATGVALAGALGASLVAFGVPIHRRYLSEVLLPRGRPRAFAGGLDVDASYVTLRRPLSILIPQAPDLLGPIAVLLLGPLVALAAHRAETRDTVGRLLVLHAVVVGVILVLPSYTVYVIFVVPTLLALLYLLPSGPGRTLFVMGAAVSTVPAGVEPARNLGLPEVLLAPLAEGLRLASPQLIGLLLTLGGVAIAANRQRRDTA